MASSQLAEWLPNSPLLPHVAYSRLMNETETDSMTSTAPHLLGTVPMGEWFTALSADLQGDITELVNEQGYPLSDIQDFIDEYGARAFADGHYITWCELSEARGANEAAILSYIDEVGIEYIGSFEEAFVGWFNSEAQFAEHWYTEMCGNDVGLLECEGLVIDWQGTWDATLSNTYAYNNGYVFNTEVG
jgi:hypothetical protein